MNKVAIKWRDSLVAIFIFWEMVDFLLKILIKLTINGQKTMLLSQMVHNVLRSRKNNFPNFASFFLRKGRFCTSNSWKIDHNITINDHNSAKNLFLLRFLTFFWLRLTLNWDRTQFWDTQIFVIRKWNIYTSGNNFLFTFKINVIWFVWQFILYFETKWDYVWFQNRRKIVWMISCHWIWKGNVFILVNAKVDLARHFLKQVRMHVLSYGLQFLQPTGLTCFGTKQNLIWLQSMMLMIKWNQMMKLFGLVTKQMIEIAHDRNCQNNQITLQPLGKLVPLSEEGSSMRKHPFM